MAVGTDLKIDVVNDDRLQKRLNQFPEAEYNNLKIKMYNNQFSKGNA
jgi:hypothetical protein